MEKYLVGGAVRDILLGKTPKDKDWVVVGETQKKMLARGFDQVGADFPVFLHPKNGEEYALARKEKSTGKGYHDFETDFGPDVTLEEDLFRRDLTINAMAIEPDEDGVIDPFGGVADCRNGVLRHVSEAFKEDPVRVLRVARFRAQLTTQYQDWVVADETKALCREMAEAGMLENLTNERVSLELHKALRSDNPRLFFDTLDDLGALETLFPVVHKMKDVEESLKWHPEGNTYEHTMLVLTAARKFGCSELQMFCALTHDFGKTLTPVEEYPSHKMHEVRGVRLVKEFADQMRVPSKYKKHAALVCRYHMHMHKLDIMNPKTFVKMFDELGAWNNPSVVDDLYAVGVADMRGKLGNENAPAEDRAKLLSCFDAVKGVKFMDVCESKGLDPQTLKGERCKQLMYLARVNVVKNWKAKQNESK